MSDSHLRELPEPVRFEAAKAELKVFMSRLQQELGLSDMQSVTVMECVLGEQRRTLCELLSQQSIAYANTLRDATAKLDAMQGDRDAEDSEDRGRK